MTGSFIRRLQIFVFHQRLFERGSGIVIGISGGPDSVCLARALRFLKDKYDLRLHLVHVNYGLRGKDSDADEEFVRKFSRQLGISLKVYRYGKRKSNGNLEEQLRDFRHEIFEKERVAKKMDWIAVAHILDDQVETFFMNLIRGTGMKGLGAMSARSGRIIRPLIIFEKKELLECLESAGQSYRVDRTNFDISLLRNKIRRKLVPLLEKEFNPQIKNRIASLANIIRSEMEWIEISGNNLYNEMVKNNKGLPELDAEKYGKLPLAQKRFVFRKIIASLKGDLKNLSMGNFNEFEKMLSSKKPKHQIMPVGFIVIERKGKKVVFEKKLKK